MLSEHNIISEIKKRFSNFEIIEEAEGLPTVIFSFLSSHIKEAINNENMIIIENFKTLFDEMCNSEDHVVIACRDEIILGLKDDFSNLDMVYKYLSVHGVEVFRDTLNKWNKQFNS